jgi:hypothetical protein
MGVRFTRGMALVALAFKCRMQDRFAAHFRLTQQSRSWPCLQIAAETAVGRGRFVGRVQHVVSGQAAHFHTLDERLACLVRMLTALDAAPEETP